MPAAIAVVQSSHAALHLPCPPLPAHTVGRAPRLHAPPAVSHSLPPSCPAPCPPNRTQPAADDDLRHLRQLRAALEVLLTTAAGGEAVCPTPAGRGLGWARPAGCKAAKMAAQLAMTSTPSPLMPPAIGLALVAGRTSRTVRAVIAVPEHSGRATAGGTVGLAGGLGGV